MLSLASIKFPGWFYEIPGISARSFNLTKHVETVTPP